MRPDGRGKINHESAHSTADVDARCPSCSHPRHSGECSAAVADGSGGYPCGCTADVDAANPRHSWRKALSAGYCATRGHWWVRGSFHALFDWTCSTCGATKGPRV